MGSKSRGYEAQIEFEKQKAVYKARIVLALQLKGDMYTSELSELLGLSLNTVAFALHELEASGDVRIAARNVRSNTRNRINLWQAVHLANYLPPSVPQPLRRVRVDSSPDTGITPEDLAYHHYWGLPKDQRAKLPPPPTWETYDSL